MKRIVCCLLSLCCLLVLLTACQGNFQTRTDVSSTPSMTIVDTSFDFDDRTTEDEELTAKGYPPLSTDLQILFQDAQEMVRAFSLCSFQTLPGITKDFGGMPYLLVNDPRFSTKDELITYLERLFTDRFIYENLLTAEGCVKFGEDGLIYVLDASGSADATYAGHVITVTNHTPSQIDFTATVYYQEDYNGEYFYDTPKKPETFTTKAMEFSLLYTQKGWRFQKCPFIQG